MNGKTKILAAVVAATLLAAPTADARKVRNTDWEQWQRGVQQICIVLRAFGFRTPSVCKAGA